MNLVLAVSGGSGAHAARLLMQKSPWPVALVATRYGKTVYEMECGRFEELEEMAHVTYSNEDLEAPISSGSVPTAGMVILPCSVNTLGRTASGLSDDLVTRAAHCHIKERRRLILCIRESPWTLINCRNAATMSEAGADVMPLSPPYYMTKGKNPESVTMNDLLEFYVDRVLGLLGHSTEKNWEDI